MAGRLPRASLLEGLRFTAQVGLPNMLQGLFRRRRRVVAVATRANVDGHAIGLIAGLRRSHGTRPLWIRLAKDEVLLLLDRDDVRRALEGAPHPFAADPEPKRKGMSHFQPDALTISRGEEWAERRRFTEAVLDTGRPVHRLGERFVSVSVEEAEALLEEVERAGGELGWDQFYRALRRITRREVLGDAARDDEEVSDLLTTLMDEANSLPDERSEAFEPFMAKLDEYARAAEEGSLVSLFAQAPSGPATRPVGQLPHWMFAQQETLATNAFRALALIASHPDQRARLDEELKDVGGDGPASAEGLSRASYLEACLQEAMRLWPTTPLLSRETLEPADWNGETVPAKTQLLICNTFNHRDPETHDFADRFAPEAWTEGDVGQDWSFNHFSHGPQGCPGAGIALLVGKAVLATLLRRQVRLLDPRLDPSRPLPRMLDAFAVRYAVS